jgi:hypothetical protein
MSRARSIKPRFFRNELLAECQPLARLLFAGLWCEADREGRLEDRPRRLKVELLPYDECDVDVLLEELAKRGFIRRYEAGGDRFIQVVAFAKHQNPHVREQASTIPAPDEHSASPVLAPDQPQSRPALSLLPLTSIPSPPSVGADAPAADPIFGTGLDFLRRKGATERAARGFLGLMRKELGDVAAAELLHEAERQDVTEPQPWIMKALQNRKGIRRGNHRESLGQSAERKLREGDERDRLAGI